MKGKYKSKGERAIADVLTKHNIDFVYEQALRIN